MMQPARSDVVHVVAGLLIEGGRVCITRRRADAHQGGKWEFPGGKLEAAEAPLDALRRELREELGIEVLDARPFMCLRHAYAEIEVLLDIWRVLRYRGNALGREAQELRWEDIGRLDPSEFPDADRPVLRRLQLPPLYAISDAQQFGVDGFAERLERALTAGVRLVQLREPQMERAPFCAYARRLSRLCRDAGARLLINAEPAWLHECEADGVHLNSRRLMSLSNRPVDGEYFLGASCHNVAELKQAQALAADFAVLGAVRRTTSHSDGPILGWDNFAKFCRSTPLPIYAIGGMRASDRVRATDSGARGLAMITGLWEAENIETVVREIATAGDSLG